MNKQSHGKMKFAIVFVSSINRSGGYDQPWNE
jgi:hypothetical protein